MKHPTWEEIRIGERYYHSIWGWGTAVSKLFHLRAIGMRFDHGPRSWAIPSMLYATEVQIPSEERSPRGGYLMSDGPEIGREKRIRMRLRADLEES